MRNTLLDKLFESQENWQECERKLAKRDTLLNCLIFTNAIVALLESYVPKNATLTNYIIFCYFAITIGIVVYILFSWKKLHRERLDYANKYYSYLEELIKSKVVEVHNESKH